MGGLGNLKTLRGPSPRGAWGAGLDPDGRRTGSLWPYRSPRLGCSSAWLSREDPQGGRQSCPRFLCQGLWSRVPARVCLDDVSLAPDQSFLLSSPHCPRWSREGALHWGAWAACPAGLRWVWPGRASSVHAEGPSQGMRSQLLCCCQLGPWPGPWSQGHAAQGLLTGRGDPALWSRYHFVSPA